VLMLLVVKVSGVQGHTDLSGFGVLGLPRQDLRTRLRVRVGDKVRSRVRLA
jgi:hypothetical protein